jgi:hypothetical protein
MRFDLHLIIILFNKYEFKKIVTLKENQIKRVKFKQKQKRRQLITKLRG